MAMNRELSLLGRTVAELEDEALATRERPPTQERLAAIHRAHARRAASRQRVSFGAPLALAGFAAVLLVVLFSRNEPLHFVVGPAKERGTLGAWVSAPTLQSTVIAFSDGSRVLLSAGVQARVLGASERGARVVVERGNVRADVVPRANNDWWVVGGPFEIHVTGTSFDASWEPEREVLRVTMYEGHVDVRGECLPRSRALSKGESATLSCLGATSAASVVSVPSVVSAPSVVSSAPSAVPLGPKGNAATLNAVHQSEKNASSVADGAPGTTAAPGPPWRAWARLGGYKEAVAAAESEGFDALCGTLSLGELLELGTTARLAGRTARAREAYSAVRARFAGSDGAATAAFHLGQMAFDGAQSYSEAHLWFAAYLSERPAGALAAEALGRTMEAEQRLGDLDAARATASRYLRAYPAGAHVRLARSLQYQ